MTAAPVTLTNSGDVLDDLISLAPNDREALERLRDFIAEMEDVLSRARVTRDYTACRLREFGVPNVEIAKMAGLADSYISRKAIANGGVRRLRRVPTAAEADGEEIGWCERCGCRIVRDAATGRWVEVATNERESCGAPIPGGRNVPSTRSSHG